jgi:DNA polymerase V
MFSRMKTPPPPMFASTVAAGFPSPADDHLEGALDLGAHLVRRPASTFFVRAAGDSMTGAGIHDGDLLVVDRSVQAQHGDVVIAVVEGELTVKRLEQADGRWWLAPANPGFPRMPVGDDGLTVWGVVVHSVTTHCRR